MFVQRFRFDQLTHLRYKLLFAFGALAHTHVFAVQ